MDNYSPVPLAFKIAAPPAHHGTEIHTYPGYNGEFAANAYSSLDSRRHPSRPASDAEGRENAARGILVCPGRQLNPLPRPLPHFFFFSCPARIRLVIASVSNEKQDRRRSLCQTKAIHPSYTPPST